MALTVIQRPDANLYVNNPPEYQEEPYYYSRWSAAFLPLVYKISNTKFPTNQEDEIDSYTAVTNNNGFAKFDLAGTNYQVYIRGEKVTITGTVYNGVYEVVASSADQLTLNVAYAGTDTGTANKYYDNYATLVRLYAGIPSYHPYTAQDPMTLIGTFSIAPNLDNVAIIDIADLVRQKISKDNNLEGTGRPNDLNAWTCFYIEYAETYDTYAGGIPQTIETSFIEDNLQGITPVSVTNPDFTSNLNGWTQVKNLGNANWVWDSGSAKFPDTGNSGYSKSIYQEINLKKSIPYKLTLTYEIDATPNKNSLLMVMASNKTAALQNEAIFTNISSTDISETVTVYFTPNQDLKYLIFLAFATDSVVTIKVNSINIEEVGVNYDVAYIFASNSARQFFDYAKIYRTPYGGNMAEYVMNYNEEGILGKFLTRFEKPLIFPNSYFDISAILPQSTLDIPFTQDGLLYRVRTMDANGVELNVTDTQIANDGDGVYRLRLDNKIGAGVKGDVQLIRTTTVPVTTDFYYDNDDQTKLYYSSDGTTFEEITLQSGYEIAGLSVYGDGKAVISIYQNISGSWYVVFYWVENGVLNYITNTINATFTAFPYIKAFDENNFVAVHPNSYIITRRNGVIGSRLPSTSNFQVIDLHAESMEYAYMTGFNTGSSQAVLIEMDEGNSLRGAKYFESGSSFVTYKLWVINGYVFTIRNKSGDTSNSYLSKFNTANNTDSSIAITYSTDYVGLAFENENNGFLLSASTIYQYTSGTVTTYTDLNSLRTSEGDSSDYLQVDYIGEGVYVVVSETHIYKYVGEWVSLGQKATTGLFYSGIFRYETNTFKISEQHPFEIDSECSNQSMHLSWLNTLGNWEHFVFTAKKSYTKNIDDFTTSSNSILANFPDNFDSETFDDKINVEAFDVVTVRSQYVERKQLDIIAEILQSLRVQYWYDTDKKITVIVDTKKVNKYTDGDKLFAIEFDIIMPKIQTQS